MHHLNSTSARCWRSSRSTWSGWAWSLAGSTGKHLGYLLRPDLNWAAAIVFYLLFVAGLLVFVVVPGLRAGSARKVLGLGALFGLITYATYDLTNLATVRDWPWLVSAVDLAWGSILGAVVSYLGFLAGKWLQ